MDKDGVLKIFDFGLAKELKPGQEKDDGRYELTGNTGSRRYMANEVAKGLPYNLSVDSYSFGILLWELCSAEKPFYGYSSGKHMQQVVVGGERPNMDAQHTAHWPMNLQWLMRRCWSPFPNVRPSFTVIKQVLADILVDKETLPSSLAELPGDEEEPVIEEPSGGFSGFFRAQKSRQSTTGTLSPPKNGFKSMKPMKPEKGRRHRSWGLGLLK